MAKQISFNEAADLLFEGAVVMVGGFMGCGSPHKLIDEILNHGIKDLTVICNDAGLPDYGVGKLICSGRVSYLIASHIGLNPVAGEKMNSGEMQVNLVPQGTLAECIRSAGAGLGGVLTPTGIGTMVAEGKQIINVKGKPYLLEESIFADIALLSGYKVDKAGNIFYRGAARNFNPIMATAAKTVIVEADMVVDIGEIEQENVHTPGLFVDYIIDRGQA